MVQPTAIDGYLVYCTGIEMRCFSSREIVAAANAEMRNSSQGDQCTYTSRLVSIHVEPDRAAIPRHHDVVPLASCWKGIAAINPAGAGEVGNELGASTPLRAACDTQSKPSIIRAIHHGYCFGLR